MKSISLQNPANSGNRAVLKEVFGVFALSLALIVLVVAIGHFVGWVRDNALALVAILFLYLPVFVLRRQNLEPADYGLTRKGAVRGTAAGFLLTLITLPLFLLGFHLWEVIVFDHHPEVRLSNYHAWPEQLRVDPGETLDGLTLWRSQRQLVLDVRGSAAWQLRIESDGLLRHQNGLRPQVLSTDTGSAWEIVGRSDGFELTFSVSGGDRLRIYAYRNGQPLEREQIHLGARSPDPDNVFPVEIERGAGWIPLWIVIQLLLVALPEEFFYRGYIQTRLSARFPQRWRLGPFHLSWPILITSVLFSLGHFAIGLDPQRLAVFFPSLAFGWLRDRTGGLAGPIVYHAACNLMVQFTVVHYWPT